VVALVEVGVFVVVVVVVVVVVDPRDFIDMADSCLGGGETNRAHTTSSATLDMSAQPDVSRRSENVSKILVSVDRRPHLSL
jgi:hypothetical protein